MDCFTRTRPDCAPVPRWDTIWIAAYVLADEVLNPITMLRPVRAEASAASSDARSGEIAPLNTYRSVSLTFPVCESAGAPAVLISYHLFSDPAPPNTACAVQIAVAPMRGS